MGSMSINISLSLLLDSYKRQNSVNIFESHVFVLLPRPQEGYLSFAQIKPDLTD